MNRDLEPGDLVMVIHWGHASPLVFEDEGAIKEVLNLPEMLAVVGARALDRAIGVERNDILSAVREERYFAIVSAYATGDKKTLLWRTHMTVPCLGLTQSQALPILFAAGAALFGRATAQIRQVVLDVSGMLRSR